MSRVFLSAQFLLVAGCNFCLFLIAATWSLLPLYILEIGGDKNTAGIVMGSLGLTSLGSLPILALLIDSYGRRIFIVFGALVAGLSNLGFLLFDHYSHLLVLVRLLQGLAFAMCFNACSTAIVDLVPPEHRAQGIGLFGVSGSLAFALGPFLGERAIFRWGFDAYFLLLAAFGVTGFLLGLGVKEPAKRTGLEEPLGFFPTAFREGYVPRMILAVVFGAGFSAMNVFFPVMAQAAGLKVGTFFIAFGTSLGVVRICLGSLIDDLPRDKLIAACLLGFGSMLLLTAGMEEWWQTVGLGALFGALHGIAYPAMMAQMVDKSRENNRGVVVALFTGSFGLGIHLSSFWWGYIAEHAGLRTMYLSGGVGILIVGALFLLTLLLGLGSKTN